MIGKAWCNEASARSSVFLGIAASVAAVAAVAVFVAGIVGLWQRHSAATQQGHYKSNRKNVRINNSNSNSILHCCCYLMCWWWSCCTVLVVISTAATASSPTRQRARVSVAWIVPQQPWHATSQRERALSVQSFTKKIQQQRQPFRQHKMVLPTPPPPLTVRSSSSSLLEDDNDDSAANLRGNDMDVLLLGTVGNPQRRNDNYHPIDIEDENDNDDETILLAASSSDSSNSNNNNKDQLLVNHQKNDHPSRPLRSLDDFLEQAAAAAAAARAADTHTTHRFHILSVPSFSWMYALIFLSLGIANSSDATEILCLSYILADETFIHTMLSSSSSTSFEAGSLLAASVFTGMLVGGLIVGGSISDVRGRRPMLLTGLCLNGLAGILAAAAPNVYVLAVLRCIAGIGIGASVPPLFTLCTELSPPSQRGFWTTVAASFWMFGSLFVASAGWIILGGGDAAMNDGLQAAAAAAMETAAASGAGEHFHLMQMIPAWRLLALTCALPSITAAIMVYRNVPDSPRFWIQQQQSLSLSNSSNNGSSDSYDRAVTAANALADCMFAGSTTSGRSVVDLRPLTKAELLHHYPLRLTLTTAATTTTTVRQQQRQEASLGDNLSSDRDDTNNSMENNDTPVPAISYQQEQSRQGVLELAPSPQQGSILMPIRSVWNDFITTSGKLYTTDVTLMRATIALQVVWFAVSFASYGLFTWINTIFVQIHMANVYQTAFLFAAANLPGNILTALVMDRAPTKARVLTAVILAACLSLLVFAYFAVNTTAAAGNTGNLVETTDLIDGAVAAATTNTANANTLGIILAACSFQCFSTAAWNCIDVLSAETFPAWARTTGMGLCTATGRLAAAMAQFVNGYLLLWFASASTSSSTAADANSSDGNPRVLLVTAALTLFMGALAPMFLPPPARDSEASVSPRDDDEDHDDEGGNHGSNTTATYAHLSPPASPAARDDDSLCQYMMAAAAGARNTTTTQILQKEQHSKSGGLFHRHRGRHFNDSTAAAAAEAV